MKHTVLIKTNLFCLKELYNPIAFNFNVIARLNFHNRVGQVSCNETHVVYASAV